MPTREQCDVFMYAREVRERCATAIDYERCMTECVQQARQGGATPLQLWAIAYWCQLPRDVWGAEMVQRLHSEEDLQLSSRQWGRVGVHNREFYRRLRKFRLYTPGVMFLRRANGE